MQIDFITIDFETADENRDSPCEIGLTFVENSKIVETRSWLIKPYCWPNFREFNTKIHGIHPNDVADALTFDQLWEELHPLLSGKDLIAHNASFDIGVLCRVLDYYEIEHPELRYACSYAFSKQAWPNNGGSYDLKYLCKKNGIKFKHHRAADDSKATAELVLKIFSEFEINQFDNLSDKLNIRFGNLSKGKHSPCHTKRDYSKKTRLDMSQFNPDPEKENPDSLFYQKKIAFTGTLGSMARRDAFQTIVDIGGYVTDTLTMDVDFLIVGQHNYALIDDSGLSGKQKKAASFSKKGAEIEIVSENFFVRNL